MTRSSITILVFAVGLAALGQFGYTMYSPSLPSIAADLNTDAASAKLTLSVYLFALGLSQPIYGPLSDRYGRRIIVIVGLSVFAAGTAAAAMTADIDLLIAARFVQGAGLGCGGVIGRAMLADTFRDGGSKGAYAYLAMTLALTTLIGPPIGGFLDHYLGWRTSLWSLFAYAAVFGLLFLGFGRETNISRAPRGPRSAVRDFWLVLQDRGFLGDLLCCVAVMASAASYFALGPFLLQNVYGLTAETFGLVSMAPAAAFLLAGIIFKMAPAGRRDRILPVVGAACIIAAGAALFAATVVLGSGATAVVLTMLALGFGTGLVYPHALSSAMARFRDLPGTSSAVIGCFQMVGSGLAAAAAAKVIQYDSLPLACVALLCGVVLLPVLIPGRATRREAEGRADA